MTITTVATDLCKDICRKSAKSQSRLDSGALFRQMCAQSESLALGNRSKSALPEQRGNRRQMAPRIETTDSLVVPGLITERSKV
jgi:hypothetical protein